MNCFFGRFHPDYGMRFFITFDNDKWEMEFIIPELFILSIKGSRTLQLEWCWNEWIIPLVFK